MGDRSDCATPEERVAERTERDLERIHDYAWNWFNYHAGQRINMFNYALAAAALAAAGYGAALDKHAAVAAAIGFVGAFVLACFILVDGRNKALVERGEAVLDAVERVLFAPAPAGSRLEKIGIRDGIHCADNEEQKSKKGVVRGFFAGRHSVHLRLIEGVLVVAFLAGGIFALRPVAAGPATVAAIGNVAESLHAAADLWKDIGDKLDRTN